MPMTRETLPAKPLLQAEDMDRGRFLPERPFGMHHTRISCRKCHAINQTGSVADHIAQAGRFAGRAGAEFQHDAGRDVTGTGGCRLIVDEELLALHPRHRRNTLRANGVGEQWLHRS